MTDKEALTVYATELTEDGDTFAIDEVRTLRLRILPDQDADITDDEFYGAFAWDERRTNDYGWTVRPDGFDGNAERLSGYDVGPIWWQPPADGPKRGTPEFDAFKSTILDLLRFGYVGVVVELCEGEDDYGRPIVRDAASLWGIESTYDPAYLAEVVADLVSEVLP